MSPEDGPAVDPLDTVRRQWEARDLGDPKRFLATMSLLRTSQVLTGTMRHALKDLNVSGTGYLLLMTLLLSESGAHPLSRLGRNLMVHPTTVTLVTDQLEGQGLVRRTPHPHDRRTTLVAITNAGRKLARQATDALREVEFGLPGLTPAQTDTLASLLDRVRLAAGDVEPLGRR